MNDEDRKFMKKLGERLGEIEGKLKFAFSKIEALLPKESPVKVFDAPKNVVGQEIKAVTGLDANKEPECVITSTFKNDSPDAVQLNQQAQDVLRKHLKQFCREANMQELVIHYKEQ